MHTHTCTHMHTHMHAHVKLAVLDILCALSVSSSGIPEVFMSLAMPCSEGTGESGGTGMTRTSQFDSTECTQAHKHTHATFLSLSISLDLSLDLSQLLLTSPSQATNKTTTFAYRTGCSGVMLLSESIRSHDPACQLRSTAALLSFRTAFAVTFRKRANCVRRAKRTGSLRKANVMSANDRRSECRSAAAALHSCVCGDGNK